MSTHTSPLPDSDSPSTAPNALYSSFSVISDDQFHSASPASSEASSAWAYETRSASGGSGTSSRRPSQVNSSGSASPTASFVHVDAMGAPAPSTSAQASGPAGGRPEGSGDGPPERSWASFNRASEKAPLIFAPPPPPRPSQPDPSVRGSSHSGTNQLTTPDDGSSFDNLARRNSVYLPIDDPCAASSQSWPFRHHLDPPQSGIAGPGPVGDSFDAGDATAMLRSSLQVNPLYGLAPQSHMAAEPYRDPQDHPYAATGQQASCAKASSSVQYSETFDDAGGVARAGVELVAEGAKGHGHCSQTTPIFRSRSSSKNSPPTSYLKRPPRSALMQQLDSPAAWLVYYFAFNLGLTIYNKRVLQGFPFPWTLTGVHTLCGAVGTQVALSYRFFTPARLTRRESATLVAFSVLYTVNIAVSNLSLHLVTVPFHQVVRATTPLFTIALSIVYFSKSYSSRTYLSLLIVVGGVGFSTYGDYGWTSWGLLLTLFGTFLAALKTVVTNAIQAGRFKLHPLDLLMRMSPLAFVQCVVYSWWSDEMARVREYGATEMTRTKAMALLVNGVIAFGLNVVSFTANKKTSALTMTVAANVKQVLTIVLAVFIFNLHITPMNFFGITLTLAGGAYYAQIEYLNKNKKKLSPHVTSPLTNVVAEGGEKRARE